MSKETATAFQKEMQKNCNETAKNQFIAVQKKAQLRDSLPKTAKVQYCNEGNALIRPHRHCGSPTDRIPRLRFSLGFGIGLGFSLFCSKARGYRLFWSYGE